MTITLKINTFPLPLSPIPLFLSLFFYADTFTMYLDEILRYKKSKYLDISEIFSKSLHKVLVIGKGGGSKSIEMREGGKPKRIDKETIILVLAIILFAFWFIIITITWGVDV
jgi:hypothetical protein